MKWLKLSTSTFDDEKIILIESQPDSAATLVVWFKLLCLAGKTDNGGVFRMSNGTPYTPEMLATILREDKFTVNNALTSLLTFGMISNDDEVYSITNWGKHQEAGFYDKRSEYMRRYMQEYRAKKALPEGVKKRKQSKQDCKNLRKPNAKSNVSTLEEEREKEKEREYTYPPIPPLGEADKPPAHTRGKYGWVKMTDDEYSRLISDLGECEAARVIAYVDESAQTTGNRNKWKDWNLVCRKASREGWGKNNQAAPKRREREYKNLDKQYQELERGTL